MEARWRAESERDPGYYATSYSSWLNYGTSLVTNIIENLQLNIKNVHLRYEDTKALSDGTILSNIFFVRKRNYFLQNENKNLNYILDTGIAFGIIIEAITTQSCDASWVPGSTSWNLSDASFKLTELDGLSVYWNHLKKEDLFENLNLGDLAVG